MRSFYLTFFATLVTLLVATATFSFVVDPGDLYLNRITNRRHLSETIELLTSRDTAVPTPHDEREFKIALADGVQTDGCFVVGSSRVLQLSSVRSGPILGCSRLVNLGVSGGTLEDLIFMSDVALSKHPQRIILGIDPWMGKWDQDARWRAFIDEVAAACEEFRLDCPLPGSSARFRDLAVNLINLEYVTTGIEHVRAPETTEPQSPDPEDLVFESQPSDMNRPPFTAFLSDGSVVYGEGTFSAVPDPVRLTYKVDDPAFDRSAMEALGELMRSLNDSVELIVFLPPFHPGAGSNPSNLPAMERNAEFEALLRDLASDLGIVVAGAYDGTLTDCVGEDFYDEIHASASCLSRIAAGS
ncbi:MAG: hypothetical protein OEX97_13575 [Acidimicrobiia bacterium]|nr:hypothetical protein [Acidimicrobiia bacterium]